MENEIKKRGGKRPGAGPKPKPAELKRVRRVLYLTDAEFEAIVPHLPADVKAKILKTS